MRPGLGLLGAPGDYSVAATASGVMECSGWSDWYDSGSEVIA
jgi:hypothetical protein